MSNIVILEGHIGADIELRHTNTAGKAVANFRMATNRKYTNAQQQLVEDTQWHNIVCWDKTAVNVAQFMRKGSHVLVEGRLQTREFPGQTMYAANGQVVVDAAGQPIQVRRFTTEVIATRVKFLDKKPQNVAYPTAGVAVQPVPAAAPAAMVATPAVATPGTVAVPGAVPGTVAATFVGAPTAGVPGTVPVNNAVPEVVVPAGV